MTPARKPRTECCCQSVTVLIGAMVAAVGIRSMAIIRACLVSGRAADRDDAGADRLRDAGFAPFRAVERVGAFGLDLGLVMGSSEVCATLSIAPPQPRPGKLSGRASPRSAPQPPQVTTATLRSSPNASPVSSYPACGLYQSTHMESDCMITERSCKRAPLS